MKKNSQKHKRRAKPKAAGARKSAMPSDALEMLKSMDENELETLLQTMRDILPAGLLEGDTVGDAVEQFEDYLERCASQDFDDDARAESMEELVDALTVLRIEANGGSREAREAMQTIGAMLDAAIADNRLTPADMMLTGKLMADADWQVPDSLKQALGKALETPMPEAEPVDSSIVASLLELAEGSGNDPFDLYDTIKTIFAALPAQAGALLLPSLLDGNNPLLMQAVAGFLLSPDAELA
jgi:hypothetical protein